jgi:hypothetical protein
VGCFTSTIGAPEKALAGLRPCPFRFFFSAAPGSSAFGWIPARSSAARLLGGGWLEQQLPQLPQRGVLFRQQARQLSQRFHRRGQRAPLALAQRLLSSPLPQLRQFLEVHVDRFRIQFHGN